jgi:hypothetical protein
MCASGSALIAPVNAHLLPDPLCQRSVRHRHQDKLLKLRLTAFGAMSLQPAERAAVLLGGPRRRHRRAAPLAAGSLCRLATGSCENVNKFGHDLLSHARVSVSSAKLKFAYFTKCYRKY